MFLKNPDGSGIYHERNRCRYRRDNGLPGLIIDVILVRTGIF